jgi:GT2 family glycosyltransferase
MIDIVIISYSANEELKKQTQDCLESLFKSERNSKQIFSVFVIESQEGVNWDHFANTKTYAPPQPYGYHKFLNFGRKLGKNKFVCLCNNDLIFQDKWASNIIKASQDHPEAFSFSPICPKTQPIYGIFPDTGNIPGY